MRMLKKLIDKKPIQEWLPEMMGAGVGSAAFAGETMVFSGYGVDVLFSGNALLTQAGANWRNVGVPVAFVVGGARAGHEWGRWYLERERLMREARECRDGGYAVEQRVEDLARELILKEGELKVLREENTRLSTENQNLKRRLDTFEEHYAVEARHA